MIFFLPSAGDPHNCLAAGKCGARVPTTWYHADQPVESLLADRMWTPRIGETPVVRVLVLAWAGEILPEGMDRAARVLAAREGRHAEHTAPAWCENWAWESYGWHLGDWYGVNAILYHGVRIRRGWGPREQVEVPRLIALGPPQRKDPMRAARALATVCAARLGGHVVGPAGAP